MEERNTSLRVIRKTDGDNFDFRILLSNKKVRVSALKIEKMGLLFKEWKSLNRNLKERPRDYSGESGFDTFEKINEHIGNRAHETITSKSSELADIAVSLCYGELGVQARAFVWKVFGRDVVQNLKDKMVERFVKVPMLTTNGRGSVKYLWSNYSIFALNMEDEI